MYNSITTEVKQPDMYNHVYICNFDAILYSQGLIKLVKPANQDSEARLTSW